MVNLPIKHPRIWLSALIFVLLLISIILIPVKIGDPRFLITHKPEATIRGEVVEATCTNKGKNVRFSLAWDIVHQPGLGAFPDGGTPFSNISGTNIYTWDIEANELKLIKKTSIPLTPQKGNYIGDCLEFCSPNWSSMSQNYLIDQMVRYDCKHTFPADSVATYNLSYKQLGIPDPTNYYADFKHYPLNGESRADRIRECRDEAYGLKIQADNDATAYSSQLGNLIRGNESIYGDRLGYCNTLK